MGEVTIRCGGLDDVEAVLAFWLYSAENTNRRDDLSKVVTLVERDPEALLIAEIDGRMAGTLVAGWDGWRAHLYRLAVDPELRRRGIGSQLIAAAEERFRRLGAFRSDAMVLSANELAHRAWQAAGYTRESDNARWVKPLDHA
jgi:ribosomal protein S18 acetylase RimI-like enzyme